MTSRWQPKEHFKLLLSCIRDSFDFQPDVRVVCADGAYLCHALILAASSTKLRSVMSQCDDGPITILLPDVPVERLKQVFDNLLNWTASDMLIEGDLEELVHLLQLDWSPESYEIIFKTHEDQDKDDAICTKPKPLRNQTQQNVVDASEEGTRSKVESTAIKEGNAHTGEKCKLSFDMQSKPYGHVLSAHKDAHKEKHCGGHNTTAALSKQFNCPDCGKVLASAYSLKLHRGVHEGTKPYSCAQCGKSFSQRSHLTVHERRHTGVKPHMCCRCGKSFAAVSNLNKHIKVHEKQNSSTSRHKTSIGSAVKKVEHKCTVCLKEFLTAWDLTVHHKAHMDDNQVAKALRNCEYCSKAFSNKSALEKHVLTHTNSRPHSCPKCFKRFVQKSHMTHHLKTVHAPPGDDKHRVHACIHCGKTFATSSTMQKHAKTHTNERPFKCGFCPMSFIQKTHLQAHLSKHTGERPFLCGTCGKSFVTKSNLKEHAKSHSDEKKRHSCTACGAEYVNVADLHIHLRRHSGETPFACTYCAKSFRAKRHLNDHLRIHRGEKPFHCHNCNKNFCAAGGLRLHFRRNDTCRLAAGPGAFSISGLSSSTDTMAAAFVGHSLSEELTRTKDAGFIDLTPEFMEAVVVSP